MNILFLAHRIPYPPDKGDKIRAYNEIKYFAAHHTVDVCCLLDDPADEKYIEPLSKMCRRLEVVKINAVLKKALSLSSLLNPKVSCTEIYFYDTRLQKAVNRLIAENTYDLIFIYCSSMDKYVRRVKNVPAVIDFVDIDSDKWMQYAKHAPFPKNIVFKIEGQKLARLEHAIAERVKASFLVTEKEVEFFGGNQTVHSVPNGIDTVFFDPAKTPADPKLQSERYVEFTGAMDYFPNEDGVVFFCEEILPHIHKTDPDLKFYIVGRNPTDKVKALASDHVVVTGGVTDIRPYIKYAQLAVTPLRMARGIQNKILEAAAMGQAVVTTSQAHEGLAFEPGRDIIVEDDPKRFAQAVVGLLNNPEKRSEIASSALKMLKKHYSWEANLSVMDSIIRSSFSK